MAGEHPSNVAKPSGEERLGYLQMEIGHGLGQGGRRVSYLTLKTGKDDGELEIEEAA